MRGHGSTIDELVSNIDGTEIYFGVIRVNIKETVKFFTFYIKIDKVVR